MFKRFTSLDQVLLLGAFLGILVLSYLLTHDSIFMDLQKNMNLETVGDINTKSPDVRKKTVLTYMWTDIKEKQDVYQGDTIFTGNDSFADINLKDGSALKIHPNSLVVLRVADNNVSLDLKFGDLQGDLAKSSKVSVKSGDEEIFLSANPAGKEKSIIQVQRKMEGPSQIRSIKGSIEVSSPKSKPTEKPIRLAENEAVKVQVPLVKNSSYIFQNLEPTQKAIWMEPKAPLHFEWKGTGDALNFGFESADDIEFTTNVQKQITKSNSVSLTHFTKGKPIYWRVRAYDNKKSELAVSETMAITAMVNEPPIITAPLQGSFLQFLRDKSDDHLLTAPKVMIQWTSTTQSHKFAIEISTDNEFKSPIVQQNTETGQFEFAPSPSSKPANFFVRVREVEEDRPQGRWSAIRAFSTFVEPEDSKLYAPILTEKNIEFNTLSSASPHPIIEWKTIPGIDAYSFQIRRAESQSKDYKTTETHSNNFAWTTYQPGRYQFRVAAISAKKKLGPFSEGTLYVTLGPIILEKLSSIDIEGNPGDKAPPRDIQLKWNSPNFAANYVVEYSSNSNFSSAKKYKTSTTSAQITLPTSGDYYFRVLPVNAKETPLAVYSNIEKLSYIIRIPLKPPALKDPSNDTTIYLQVSEDPYLTFSWTPVEQAESYDLEISKSKDFTSGILAETTNKTKFVVKHRISQGKNYWRVRAKNSKKISNWSQTRIFYLYTGQANDAKGENE